MLSKPQKMTVWGQGNPELLQGVMNWAKQLVQNSVDLLEVLQVQSRIRSPIGLLRSALAILLAQV